MHKNTFSGMQISSKKNTLTGRWKKLTNFPLSLDLRLFFFADPFAWRLYCRMQIFAGKKGLTCSLQGIKGPERNLGGRA